MQTDVITSHVSIIEKAILISASFSRHFDPHSKKETRKNKSQLIAKFLTITQNKKNVLKKKHFLLESSVIEVLRKIFFKTSFSVCLYFSRLRPFGRRRLNEHTPLKAFFLRPTRQLSFLQNLSFSFTARKLFKSLRIWFF